MLKIGGERGRGGEQSFQIDAEGKQRQKLGGDLLPTIENYISCDSHINDLSSDGDTLAC